MNLWIECALGAIICVVWVFGQYRLHTWAEQQPTRFRTTLSVVSRYLLATAITLIGFTVVGAIVEILVRAVFAQ